NWKLTEVFVCRRLRAPARISPRRSAFSADYVRGAAGHPGAPQFDSGVSSRSPELHGVDLGHDLLLQPLEVVERLRNRHVLERRPEKRHRQPGLLVALELVGDLRGGSCQQIAALTLRSLIGLLVRDDEPEHVADLETVGGARAAERLGS